jgi:dihydroxyacetone kinase phosphoprotein-dependent L subunit
MTALRHCVLAAADAIDAARDELGALDGIAGDGDHGVTMATAARNIRVKLAAAPDADGADLLRQVALGVGSVGGAIGPIYATAIIRIAALPLTAPLTVEQLAKCAEAAETGITTLGKAKPGDKTVIDALHPVAVSLRASADAGEEIAPALAKAVEAAKAGAAATADMIATIGRASRLGERSRGWADPGATSFSIIVGALVAAFESAR